MRCSTRPNRLTCWPPWQRLRVCEHNACETVTLAPASSSHMLALAVPVAIGLGISGETTLGPSYFLYLLVAGMRANPKFDPCDLSCTKTGALNLIRARHPLSSFASGTSTGQASLNERRQAYFHMCTGGHTHIPPLRRLQNLIRSCAAGLQATLHQRYESGFIPYQATRRGERERCDCSRLECRLRGVLLFRSASSADSCAFERGRVASSCRRDGHGYAVGFVQQRTPPSSAKLLDRAGAASSRDLGPKRPFTTWQCVWRARYMSLLSAPYTPPLCPPPPPPPPSSCDFRDQPPCDLAVPFHFPFLCI